MSKMFEEGNTNEKNAVESTKIGQEGALRGGSKRRKVVVDPEMKGATLPPAGIYKVVLLSIDEEQGHYGMNYVPTFEIVDASNPKLKQQTKGMKFRDLISVYARISPNSKFGRFVRALIKKQFDTASEIDLEELIGLDCWAFVERSPKFKLDYIVDGEKVIKNQDATV